jgi:hypothetical protein
MSIYHIMTKGERKAAMVFPKCKRSFGDYEWEGLTVTYKQKKNQVTSFSRTEHKLVKGI